MKRRRASSRRPAKAQRTIKSKRVTAVKGARRSKLSIADLQKQVTLIAHELSEAREQQNAISEVLRVISSSVGDLKAVFQAVLENATRICEAKFGILWLRDGDGFCSVALHNVPPAYAELRQREPVIRPGPGTGLGRVAKTKQVVQVVDVRAEAAYIERDPLRVSTVELGGYRTVLDVPMLKANELIGVITFYRQEVRPFTEKQIALLANFAAQAVIAIENARLLAELHQRTDDLSEALEQQTATSEVLKIISASPAELQSVFQATIDNATRLCGAKFGALSLREGDVFRNMANVALHGVRPAYFEERLRDPIIRPTPGHNLERVLRTKAVVHIPDLALDVDAAQVLFERAGARALLNVPLLKDDDIIGSIMIYREVPEAFSDKQIELVQSFAAQAVIAIENVRILNELRESLQQQTATADVLKIISNSPGQLGPVFEVILENATTICEAKFGLMLLREGEVFRHVALYGAPPEFAEYRARHPTIRFDPKTVNMRALAAKQVVQIADATAEQVYLDRSPDRVAIVELGGARTLLAAPLFKDDELIGFFNIYRQQVRPFTAKQVVLVQNFAAQAVIAIENARLLNELRESLQQQTATADVLKVISRSAFDLQTVFDTLIASAAQLCRADRVAMRLLRDDVYHTVAMHGYSAHHFEYMRRRPTSADRASIAGRVVLEGKPVHIVDIQTDPELTLVRGAPALVNRSMLGIPLLREGTPIGVFILARAKVEPFTEKQIELVQTFADQAVIAIENVRLFESVETRTRELAKSLEDLQTAQDRLVQTQKLASLGQLTAGIAHEIKNPLNFVNNFSSLSTDLLEELQDALHRVSSDEKTRAEIDELTETLRGNLDKIEQHGKRANSIVKNMLLHSREGSGEHRPVDINALVEESLNLAYHGARAEKQGFNITLEKSFDPAAGEVDLFPQEITRVLLNLISNGFYAATKRKAEADGGDYEAILAAATKNLGDSVEIRIRDNGTGIPPEVQEKMFNPFFTTKPAGEGTGLGLSLSHDIIVKQHGGSIEVDTQPGEFTEFRMVLPRGAATIAKSGERK